MHHGITFRGKHSDNFKIAVKTVGRPIIPPVKQTDEEVAYRDGNVDFSETGGRLYYDDKVLELDFNIISSDTVKLQTAVSKIARWLSGGYGELVFDDMPRVIWIAKPVDIEDLTMNLFKNGHTKVQFRCRPFNKWIYDSRGIPLDSDYPLDSDIPIGFGEENEIIFSAGEIVQNLNYTGSAPIRPVVNIELSGGVTGFSLSVNGSKAELINADSRSLIIDCENAVMPQGLQGDFFELQAGDNEIIINSKGGGGTVIFEYKHNLLYGEELD